MVTTTKNESKTEYIKRPPVVTIMGHVDHGKTSILDFIRKTNVTGSEYGGITQHIGAYQILHKDQKITFIDTPGHAAFSQMRARGGRASDIVVLVVSAEEGVKPQTREALAHARAANVPIIVAINKIDLPGSNPQKVKQELASENLLVEDWGGQVIAVELSAKTGKNVEGLLDAILAVAEVANLKGSPSGELEAVIIESRLDKKRGPVVSCVIKSGTLKLGDTIVASGMEARVKSLTNDKGQSTVSVSLSDPVGIMGFKDTPQVGDTVTYKGSELAQLAADENKIEIIGKNAKKAVAIVLKSDTQGTLEAVKGSLAELVSTSVESSYALKFLHCATGDINESDVMLVQSTKGLVIGFDVKIPANIADLAESVNVIAKTYKTIYELVDDAKELLQKTALKEELKIKGRAQVVKIFKLESGDIIAGSKVIAGALKLDQKVNIYDKNPADLKIDDLPLFTGEIKKLKQGKDDVKVVGRDNECGVLLKPSFEDVKIGMWIESK